jgi:hypothetical protein
MYSMTSPDVRTHLVAHSGPTDILIAEHSSEPEEWGYQYGDVEVIPAPWAGEPTHTTNDLATTLEKHGYRLDNDAVFCDTGEGGWAVQVERA